MEPSANLTKPSVFEYTDHREYLGSMYRYYKSRDEKFSFRFFARRAGFRSPNFLKLVIDGARNLSEDSAKRCAEAFRLSLAESDFLIKLVRFNHCKNSAEKSAQAEELLRAKGLRKIRPLTLAQFAYYANWYYIPIREMVALEKFREDSEWISKQLLPSVEPHQVTRAIEDLLALGLLERDGTGKLQLVDLTVTTPNEVSSSSIVKYHLEMIRKAGESISTVRSNRREISAVCIPVSENALTKIKQRIQEFRAEILAIASEDQKPEMIYQLNFQFFPLSDRENLKKDKT